MFVRALFVGAFVVVLLAASLAHATGGGWMFDGIFTLDFTMYPYPYSQVDGRIYMPDGTSLVPDGSLVQIIIGVNGADIVDPLEHFDDPLNGGNGNGMVDGCEISDVLAWMRDGADPAAISGGTNVLAYGTLGFTGEFATSGGAVNWQAPPGSNPVIANGSCQDKLAWRAWNLSKESLMKWGDIEHYPEEGFGELWYTDGREYFTHDNVGGGPDTGWWIGMPTLQPGDPTDLWVGFNSPIGAEIYFYYVEGQTAARSENRLDHFLGACIPEPGAMLLVASGLLLLLARRAGSRLLGSE
jgi:hypothetical protein